MYIPRSSMGSESMNEKSNISSSRAQGPQATNESCCRCSNHKRETSQLENPKRVVEFSADMLKDQELLVTTLSQQGISEALIRRQFNKLLEEQCKQLARLQRDKEPNCDRKPISEASARESPSPAPLQDPRKRSEPSSLLKLRVKREMQDSRSRNNGLQDLATAAQIIDKSNKHNDSITAAVAQLRLDGTQDSAAVDPESEFCRSHALRQPQLSCASLAPLNVSANGLANSRSLPQRSASQQHCQPGGDVQQQQQPQQQQQQSRVEVERSLEDAQAQYSHTAQQSATCYPELQEPRVFGGFTYFARKPQAACLPQFPHVNSSRSTTAF